MNTHISHPLRLFATIDGYRRLCGELEAENQALKFQNRELRARLDQRIVPTFDRFDGIADFEVVAPSLRRSNVAAMSVAVPARH